MSILEFCPPPLNRYCPHPLGSPQGGGPKLPTRAQIVAFPQGFRGDTFAKNLRINIDKLGF